MRELTDHLVGGVNEKLKITVVDAEGAGGANHAYLITGMNDTLNPSYKDAIDAIEYDTPAALVLFQNGPLQAANTNGVTHEALLAILIDRLRAYQAGPYSSRYNAIALTHLEDALMWLQKRTRDRLERGVKDTYAK